MTLRLRRAASFREVRLKNHTHLSLNRFLIFAVFNTVEAGLDWMDWLGRGRGFCTLW